MLFKNIRFEQAELKIIRIDGRSIEMILSEEQKDKRMKKMRRAYEACEAPSTLQHTSWEDWKERRGREGWERILKKQWPKKS